MIIKQGNFLKYYLIKKILSRVSHLCCFIMILSNHQVMKQQDLNFLR